MKVVALALLAAACGKSAPEWANNDDDVLAVQRSVRAAEETWLAASGKCNEAVDTLAKAAQRARPAELASWPTGPAVCWTPGNGACHPDVLRRLTIVSPCGAATFPEIMPMQVRVKDKARVLAEARKRLDAVASKMPPDSPALEAMYIQDCHTTDKQGDLEARFAEPGTDIGGTGGFVRCDLAVVALDGNHVPSAMAFANATGVVAPKGGAGGTYSEQEVSTAVDAVMASTLDEAVGKLVAKHVRH